MNKRVIKTTLVLILAILAIGVFILNITLQKQEVKKIVSYYLYIEKGYNQTDIKEIDIDYHIDSNIFGYNPYFIDIIFSDEPETVYHYNQLGKTIHQCGTSGKSYGLKHIGK